MRRYELKKSVTITVKGKFLNDKEALSMASSICRNQFGGNELDTSCTHDKDCFFAINSDDWSIKASEEIIDKEYVLNKLKELKFVEVVPNLYRGIVQSGDGGNPQYFINKIYFVYLERDKGYYWDDYACVSSQADHSIAETWIDIDRRREVKTFRIEA
jgi:hypothetical protein